jgi:hypothetical protein
MAKIKGLGDMKFGAKAAVAKALPVGPVAKKPGKPVPFDKVKGLAKQP